MEWSTLSSARPKRSSSSSWIRIPTECSGKWCSSVTASSSTSRLPSTNPRCLSARSCICCSVVRWTFFERKTSSRSFPAVLSTSLTRANTTIFSEDLWNKSLAFHCWTCCQRFNTARHTSTWHSVTRSRWSATRMTLRRWDCRNTAHTRHTTQQWSRLSRIDTGEYTDLHLILIDFNRS